MKQILQKHFVGAAESSKGQRVKPERKKDGDDDCPVKQPNQARAKEANIAEAKIAETSTNFIDWSGIKNTLLHNCLKAHIRSP